MASTPIIPDIIKSGKREGKYYEALPSTLPKETFRLFEEYVGVEHDNVIPYLSNFRDDLWDVYPWPCVGQFKFVSLTLHMQPSYDRIKDIVRNGGRYLDFGCAAGQDLRYLVMDSQCKSSNTFGLDKMDGYIETAYEYFKDRDTLETTFLACDLFDRRIEGPVEPLRGTVDILHAGMVLHVWDLEGQYIACERLIELLVPQKGALIVGNSVAHRNGTAGAYPSPEGGTMYKHDEESFRSMWEDVGKRTGTRWAVRTTNSDVVGLNGETAHWVDLDTTRLFWEVERL